MKEVPSRSSEPVARVGDQALYPWDIGLVDDPHWWNDSLVAFFQEHLKKTLPSGSKVSLLPPSLVLLLTFPWFTFADAKAQLEPLSLSTQDMVLVPVNSAMGCTPDEKADTLGVHWSLLAYDQGARTFFRLDSIAASPNVSASALVARLLGSVLGLDDRSVKSLPCPQQGPSDCGPFMCAFIEQLVEGHQDGKGVVETVMGFDAQRARMFRGRLEDIIAMYMGKAS